MNNSRPRASEAQRTRLTESLTRLRTLLLKQAPHLASLIFRPAIRYQPGNHPTNTASTNGRHITLAEPFFDLPVESRTASGTFPGPAAGVLLHEIFHIALGHIPRGAALRNRLTKPYNHYFANIAADCIINDVIASWKPVACTLPEDTYVGSRWLPEVRKHLADNNRPIPPAISRPTSESTMEELHDALLEAFPRTRSNCTTCNGSGTVSTHDPNPDPQHAPTKASQPVDDSTDETNPEDNKQQGDKAAPQDGNQQDDSDNGQQDDGQHDDSGNEANSQHDAQQADSPNSGSKAGPQDGNQQGNSGNGQQNDDPDAPHSSDSESAASADPGTASPNNSPHASNPAGANPSGQPRNPASGLPRTCPCPDCTPVLPAHLQRNASDPLQIPDPAKLDEIEADTEDWRRALKEAATAPGSQPGNEVLKALDIPRVRYPWQRILASVISNEIIPRPGYDPRSLSRNVIVAAAAGYPIYADPGYTNATLGGTLCVLLDSSGSMFFIPNLIPRLLGHINTITKLAGVQVHLIVGDTEIKLEKQDLDLDTAEIDSTAVSGGGGTELDALFDRARELRPTAILCMTDGFLYSWPDRPQCPVIWIAPEEGSLPSDLYPWGKLVSIP